MAERQMTEAQIKEFFTNLSNWGKWGPKDQLGALPEQVAEKCDPRSGGFTPP